MIYFEKHYLNSNLTKQTFLNKQSDSEKLPAEASYSMQPSSRASQRRLRKETHSHLAGQMAQLIQAPKIMKLGANEPSYSDLVCTEQDKKLIAELTGTLAKHNKFWFIIHAHELKKKVKTFKNRVHVLKILETVFTNPKLKTHITEIFNDSTKWDAVVKETKRKMGKAEKNGLLHVYVDDFATAVGSPPEEIRGFFLRKDWKGLLNHLVSRIKQK